MNSSVVQKAIPKKEAILIQNTKVTINDDDVAFRINLDDAVQAFETITRKKITFNVAYHDDSLLIYSRRDDTGKQNDIDQIQATLDEQ